MFNFWISVKDFKSPKELAEYLLKLDKNTKAHSTYEKCPSDLRKMPIRPTITCPSTA